MTSAQIALLALIPAAYLVGSVPFGLIVGLARGVDPRKAGSGNIGATNVGRLLGGRFFALVFTLDLLKGLLPTLAAGAVLGFDAHDPLSYVLWLSVAFGTIAGHMFSIFLRFKGGKGVATSAGVILGVFPYYTVAAAPAILVFLLAIKVTKYVSVASILGTSAFLVAYVICGSIRGWGIFTTQLPLLAFAVLVVAMIIFKHRGNLARLRSGTEHRIGSGV
jgi:glycerol-3-phosphate acyltransferase PlsY